jgi:hypothetical protein
MQNSQAAPGRLERGVLAPGNPLPVYAGRILRGQRLSWIVRPGIAEVAAGGWLEEEAGVASAGAQNSWSPGRSRITHERADPLGQCASISDGFFLDSTCHRVVALTSNKRTLAPPPGGMASSTSSTASQHHGRPAVRAAPKAAGCLSRARCSTPSGFPLARLAKQWGGGGSGSAWAVARAPPPPRPPPAGSTNSGLRQMTTGASNPRVRAIRLVDHPRWALPPAGRRVDGQRRRHLDRLGGVDAPGEWQCGLRRLQGRWLRLSAGRRMRGAPDRCCPLGVLLLVVLAVTVRGTPHRVPHPTRVSWLRRAKPTMDRGTLKGCRTIPPPPDAEISQREICGPRRGQTIRSISPVGPRVL